MSTKAANVSVETSRNALEEIWGERTPYYGSGDWPAPHTSPWAPDGAIDPIIRPTTHADDSAVAHTDVQPATIRKEHAARLNPLLWLLTQNLIDPRWKLMLQRT